MKIYWYAMIYKNTNQKQTANANKWYSLEKTFDNRHGEVFPITINCGVCLCEL